MSRILVTGGAGFIGANFVRFWRQHHPGDSLIVLDALTYAGRRENLGPLERQPGFRFVQGDIRDGPLVESLLRHEKIATIVHFAAESHVDRSIAGPDAFIDTNIVGTHSLLKAARSVWLDAPDRPTAHRFHHVSTDEVYGTLALSDPPFTEETPCAPNSPYAASKAASDHLVRAYHRTFGLATTTSRCSNNYGPRQFPEKLIPLTIIHMLLGRPVPIYGDGQNRRDWLFVDDHCRGIECILDQGEAGEVYNIGGGDEMANLDLVRRIGALIDEALAQSPDLKRRFPRAPAAARQPSESLISFVPDRPGHDRRYAILPRKMMDHLGYRPQVSLDDGLRSTLGWYLANEAWWHALLKGS
jgi:dTDP-glucose 4,6-dehydratase